MLVLQRPAQAHAKDTLALFRVALDNLLVQKREAIKAKEQDFDRKEVLRDNITFILSILSLFTRTLSWCN